MHRGRRLCFALMLWLVSFAACAYQGELTAADRIAIRAVIDRQLEAFRLDDAASAFALASPDIRARFSSPENFLIAVKTFYEPVYRPRRTGGFTRLYIIDGYPTQPVLLVGPGGDYVVALYTMQRQPGGDWKILGCSLIPDN
jgi:Domain of unknown function (DUF4864)